MWHSRRTPRLSPRICTRRSGLLSFCVVVTVVVSMLTKPVPDSELTGLVYGQTEIPSIGMSRCISGHFSGLVWWWSFLCAEHYFLVGRILGVLLNSLRAVKDLVCGVLELAAAKRCWCAARSFGTRVPQDDAVILD